MLMADRGVTGIRAVMPGVAGRMIGRHWTCCGTIFSIQHGEKARAGVGSDDRLKQQQRYAPAGERMLQTAIQHVFNARSCSVRRFVRISA
jgi:hypothetical protein